MGESKGVKFQSVKSKNPGCANRPGFSVSDLEEARENL